MCYDISSEDNDVKDLEIPNYVDIYFAGRIAGKLFSEGGDVNRSVFEYDDAYTGSAISPDLPTNQKKHSTIGLFSSFADSTADGYGRTLINTDFIMLTTF
jgi:hypothetical protein